MSKITFSQESAAQEKLVTPLFMQKRIRNILFAFPNINSITVDALAPLYDHSCGYYDYIQPLSICYRNSSKEVLKILEKEPFDLAILPYQLSDMRGFDLAKKIKSLYPKLPLAMLTSEKKCQGALTFLRDHRHVDRIFIWDKNPRIVFAIIKIFEDYLNVKEDVEINNGRAILVVEDDPQAYSKFLPLLYKELIHKRRFLLRQSFPESEFRVHKHTRPKIFLAVSYEEAIVLFNQYRHNIIGCICDCEFALGTKLNPRAGELFAKFVHENNWRIPILLQSHDSKKGRYLEKQHIHFLYKNSKNYLQKLIRYLEDYFGFGDFIFRMPDGVEIDRAKNVLELIEKIRKVNFKSLLYHAKRNHFSTWFYVHGEYELATHIFPITVENPAILRNQLIKYVEKYRYIHASYVS